MPFHIRKLPFRRRFKNCRSESVPNGNSCVQPITKQPSIDLRHRNYEDEATGSNASYNATNIDAYEDRIDELGQLMVEQGRCLDELTARSRRLSSENNLLRERLSASVAVKQSPRESFALPASTTRSPLKNIRRNFQRSGNNETATQLDVQKLHDDNSLLLQQAELLANELNEANKLLVERDESLSSLGSELSSCLEKARACT